MRQNPQALRVDAADWPIVHDQLPPDRRLNGSSAASRPLVCGAVVPGSTRDLGASSQIASEYSEDKDSEPLARSESERTSKQRRCRKAILALRGLGTKSVRLSHGPSLREDVSYIYIYIYNIIYII